MEVTAETKGPIFLRMREVSQIIGLKPAAIDRAIRAGTFPRPFLIGVKAKGFARHEVEEWMHRRSAARNTYADAARPSSVDVDKLGSSDSPDAAA